MVAEMTPAEFVERRDAGEPLTLLDVRESWELDIAAVPSTLTHIPMGEIANRLGELDPRRATVVVCRSGGRSAQVAQFLSARGFDSVFNLTGGILRWSKDLDPRIAQY